MAINTLVDLINWLGKSHVIQTFLIYKRNLLRFRPNFIFFRNLWLFKVVAIAHGPAVAYLRIQLSHV